VIVSVGWESPQLNFAVDPGRQVFQEEKYHQSRLKTAVVRFRPSCTARQHDGKYPAAKNKIPRFGGVLATVRVAETGRTGGLRPQLGIVAGWYSRVDLWGKAVV
jgi:hypothetical protein